MHTTVQPEFLGRRAKIKAGPYRGKTGDVRGVVPGTGKGSWYLLLELDDGTLAESHIADVMMQQPEFAFDRPEEPDHL